MVRIVTDTARTRVIELSAVRRVAVGENHVCAITRGGALFCWGDNRGGQLGDGSLQSASVPVRIDLANVDDLALGKTTPARRRGKVYCWGRNDPYQHLGWEGSGRQRTPRLNNVNGVFSLSSSSGSPAAPPPRSTILGASTGSSAGGATTTTTSVRARRRAQDAGTRRRATNMRDVHRRGQGHACALKRDGTVHCWGANEYGQLGPGNDNDTDSLVRAGQLVEVTEIAAGAYHTCARDDAGAIYCWGTNGQGSLGIAERRSTPTRLQTF